MNVLCRIFGHKPPTYSRKGWWSPGEEYGHIRFVETDGIGRQHATVYGECARCGCDFRVVRVHLPQKPGGSDNGDQQEGA